ncbi:MAG: hypothetical protein II621_08615 [Clostridia bacterium]|jgi:hypothetical protein|nr:hypothetical protein [Clostridia bacterium]MBQ4366131.1 hypothetical protein [Clostridia bacterium]MBQ6092444.1 hypothetical protein [Clostridia bacterium]MBR3096012.1 hypothetical protein [Clostridia bacterium]
MDNLIRELVQVDKQARMRVSKAKKQRAVALEQLERDKTLVREENEAALASYLEERKTAREALREEALRGLEADNARVIAALDEAYEANRESWVRAIVENVTK